MDRWVKEEGTHLGYRHSSLKARHPLLFRLRQLGFPQPNCVSAKAKGGRQNLSGNVWWFESYYNLVYHQEKLVYRRRKH